MVKNRGKPYKQSLSLICWPYFLDVTQKDSYVGIVLHFCIVLYSTSHYLNFRSDLPNTANKTGKANHSFFCAFMEENTFSCADKRLRLSRYSELNHVKLKLPELKKCLS